MLSHRRYLSFGPAGDAFLRRLATGPLRTKGFGGRREGPAGLVHARRQGLVASKGSSVTGWEHSLTPAGRALIEGD